MGRRFGTPVKAPNQPTDDKRLCGLDLGLFLTSSTEINRSALTTETSKSLTEIVQIVKFQILYAEVHVKKKGHSVGSLGQPSWLTYINEDKTSNSLTLGPSSSLNRI